MREGEGAGGEGGGAGADPGRPREAQRRHARSAAQGSGLADGHDQCVCGITGLITERN